MHSEASVNYEVHLDPNYYDLGWLSSMKPGGINEKFNVGR